MTDTPTPDLTAPSTAIERLQLCIEQGLSEPDLADLWGEVEALSAKLKVAEEENEDCLDKLEAALDQRDTADGRADYWHQESRIQFEAKNKARAERDALLCAIAYATTELRQSSQDVHAIRAEAALTKAYRTTRQEGGEG